MDKGTPGAKTVSGIELRCRTRSTSQTLLPLGHANLKDDVRLECSLSATQCPSFQTPAVLDPACAVSAELLVHIVSQLSPSPGNAISMYFSKEEARLKKVDPCISFSDWPRPEAYQETLLKWDSSSANPANNPPYDPSIFGNFSRCSRAWADAVGEYVNSVDIVGATAMQLRQIKQKALCLDLRFLHKSFMSAVEGQLGTFDLEEYIHEDEVGSEEDAHIGSVLKVIIMEYKKRFPCIGSDALGGDALDACCDSCKGQSDCSALTAISHAVESAYRKFLVVKAVETAVSARGLENQWMEKCCASPIIDVFWHAHLLHPKHYLETCSAMLGYVGVIDHDPGYINPKRFVNSTLGWKMKQLFSREHELNLSTRSIHNDRSHFENKLIHYDSYSWIEEAFIDRVYGDEMECG